jgi:N-acetylglucosaminyldiphosphoundecaprenol N-acetyl-beta-D-mannosaminyltransferase
MKPKPYKFLGIRLHALSISELNSLIAESIQLKQKWTVAHHNLHSLYIYHHDYKMRMFYKNAEYIHIDGMLLVFLGKLLGFPLKREQRVTYADWIWALMEESAKNNWRVFYIGSKPGVAERAAAILRSKFSGLQIATSHGYIDAHPDSLDNLAILATIKAYEPHIVMVGMGMPRQEYWILDNLDSIYANTILPSGACMDYVAGVISTPPRWMGRLGLEWLYRLFNEPKRLWKRYLVEPWFIVGLLAKEIFKTKAQIHY